MQEKHVSAIQPTRGVVLNAARPGRSQNARPTIGFFNLEISNDYALWPWLGIVDAAQKHDVNLVTYVGNIVALNSIVGQANVLYDLAKDSRLDGLIIWKAGLVMLLSETEAERFCKQYDIPVVTLEGRISGLTCVSYENYQGMRSAVEHLIEVHGYRKIGFLGMYEHSAGFQERYQGYVDAMTAHGLPIDPRLARPWFPTHEIASGMIDERVLTSYLEDASSLGMEAIIGIADSIAQQVQRKLQERGARVPDDVAVVGFDDFTESRVLTPPLTTVMPSWYEFGQLAAETLIGILAGKPAPEQLITPSRLMVRQSCGCQDLCVKLAGEKPGDAAPSQGQAALQPIQIASEMVQAAQASALEGIHQEVADLIEAFRSEVNGEESGAFLNTFERVLQHAAKATNEVSTWHNAISILRRQVLPEMSHNAERVACCESLLQQAQVMIGRVAERAQAAQRFQATQQENHLRAVGHSLITALSIDKLVNVLAEGLPDLGIPSCYLSLFEGPKSYRYPDPAPEWARLILAFSPQGRTQLEQDGKRFPARQLIPDELWPQDRACSFVLSSLYFQENQFGFVLFEVGRREGAVYEALRAQISSALQGAMLVQRVEGRSTQLQTAAEVSRATTSILDLDELLPQVVELIRDRFNLYYVGLFLKDEAGQYAVLRAGVGAGSAHEAGQQMLAAGHTLEVGGSSMIGWCTAQGQARIALDVGEEAVRFGNPLLPQTRSELALPLISRGQVIGAMTIQSDQPAAFTEEDISILQTMAGPVANAIENARLNERAQTALKEMEATQRRYVQKAWAEYLPSAKTTHYEIGRPGSAPLGDAVLPEIQQAAEQQSTVALSGTGDTGATHSALVTPITLHGSVIGALGIHDDQGTRQWTAEEIALVEAVADRMAQTAETLRLFDETQHRAEREALIRQITTRIRAASDIQGVLETTATELARSMGVSRSIVRLTPDEKRKE